MGNITQDEKEIIRIKELLKNMQINLLNRQEYTELQKLLLRRREFFCTSYPLVKTNIPEDKIMFIADSHSGNIMMENLKLVDIAYNKALQQGIKKVIHAGDLTEACPVERNKTFETVLKELTTAISHMPSEITTDLLLGNHDYSAIRNHPGIIPYYFSTPKLYVLGLQQVLINWGETTNILVSHPISQLKMGEDGYSKADIVLEGHHHYYNFYEEYRQINIPSTSKETLHKLDSTIYNKYNQKYCYLFVIASKQDENINLFEVYSINRDNLNDICLSDTIELNTKTKQLRLYK